MSRYLVYGSNKASGLVFRRGEWEIYQELVLSFARLESPSFWRRWRNVLQPLARELFQRRIMTIMEVAWNISKWILKNGNVG